MRPFKKVRGKQSTTGAEIAFRTQRKKPKRSESFESIQIVVKASLPSPALHREILIPCRICDVHPPDLCKLAESVELSRFHGYSTERHGMAPWLM